MSNSYWLDLLHIVGQSQDQEERFRHAGERGHFVKPGFRHNKQSSWETTVTVTVVDC